MIVSLSWVTCMDLPLQKNNFKLFNTIETHLDYFKSKYSNLFIILGGDFN